MDYLYYVGGEWRIVEERQSRTVVLTDVILDTQKQKI